MHAVGSITWPRFNLFWVNNLATVESITWPHFSNPLFYRVFLSFLSAQFSGGGAKLLFGKVVFGQNWGFRKWVVAFFFGGGGLVVVVIVTA